MRIGVFKTLEFLFTSAYFKNCCGQKFSIKTIYKPIITLVLVGWWRHQNKKVSVCFKFFLLLDKHLMTWIFEVFVERAFCEPMITLTLMTSSYTIRKFSFVGMLISPLDTINSLWLKLRANEKSRWCLIREFFYFLDSSFFLFCLRKYWLLKFNTFFGRTIITLKINSWKRNQKLNCVFKSLVSFVYLIILNLKMLSDNIHFVMVSTN